jgi:uncharacterized protein (TIGR03437 family)
MLNRNVSLAVCLCLAASVVALGQPGAAYVFLLPGITSQGSRIQTYPYAANPFNPSADVLGPQGAAQVFAKPDGTRFYILGSGGNTSLQSTDQNLTSFRSINGLGAPPTSIAITPDGKFLLVGADSLYIVDTNNDQIVGSPLVLSGAVAGTGSCPICTGIAVSRDSKTAWVLTNTSFGSVVQAFNLTTRQRIGLPLNLTGGATSISLSPLGLLYVTAVNRVFEIDPATLQVTLSGVVPLVATPGPLRYTPDGTTAYFVNFSPATGGVSIYKLNLLTKSTSTWPPFNSLNQVPTMDDVYVASNGRVFSFSSQSTTLFDVTPAPFGAAVSTLSGILAVQSVSGVTVSNELPSARFLYVETSNVTQTTLYRIDLATNSISIQTQASLFAGVLQFVGFPAQSNATSFLQYNNLQTLKAGDTSQPLIVRVLDTTGRPIFNIPVTFTVDPTSGVVINTPAPITNGDGYAQTTVTMPSTPGLYTVTVTAGGATATFSLTIPGQGCTVNCNPGTTSQVTIVSGNGQLVDGFTGTVEPLTILVVDTTGAPLSGVPVTFTLTAGGGNVGNPQTVTDSNGQASTTFFALPPGTGLTFQANDINAATAFGSVDFTETVLIGHDPFGLPSRPIFDLVKPSLDDGLRIVVGEGDTLTDAVIARITSNTSPQIGVPIPGVAIALHNPDTTQPSPASCQQPAILSDVTAGLAHCTVVAACGQGTFPIRFDIGDYQAFFGTLQITKGTSSLISILAGNNQTGFAGSKLPITLTALVSDKCGAVTGGVKVTWTVTQGSATLLNTVSLSDSGGRVSTGVQLGQTPGAVQVTVAIGSVTQAVFNITNQVVVNSLTVTGGNNQTTTTGSNFALPVTFTVTDVAGKPVAGILLTFTVTTGSAGVTPSSATTNAAGQASTVVSAGVPAGPITITASYNNFSAIANLTSRQPGPTVNVSSFVNGASFLPGLVPCGFATVMGTGLADGIIGTVFGNNSFVGISYTLTLNGLSITVNGVSAPIVALTNSGGPAFKQQATFQTPCETTPGNATVVVTVNGGFTQVVNVPVFAAQPGIFTAADPINGKSYAQVIDAVTHNYVTSANPARRGGSYFVFTTGLGQVSPPAVTNTVGTGQAITAPLVVGVGGAGAGPNAGQYLANAIGLYLVSFTIPANLQTGTDVPITVGIVINGQTLFDNQGAKLAGVF